LALVQIWDREVIAILEVEADRRVTMRARSEPVVRVLQFRLTDTSLEHTGRPSRRPDLRRNPHEVSAEDAMNRGLFIAPRAQLLRNLR
jgi:hypothetical protein